MGPEGERRDPEGVGSNGGKEDVAAAGFTLRVKQSRDRTNAMLISKSHESQQYLRWNRMSWWEHRKGFLKGSMTVVNQGLYIP